MLKRQNLEYELCKALAQYLRMHKDKPIYHYDLSGLNLSMAQAGMSKVIQGGRGWCDLFIAEARKDINNFIYHGLFIEIKKTGTRIHKMNGECTTPHIAEQKEMMLRLRAKGYFADFGIGFDDCKRLIDNYFELDKL